MTTRDTCGRHTSVIVLGGSGQLGSACVHHFLSLGWAVHAPPVRVFDCARDDPRSLPLERAGLVVNGAGVINKRIHAGDESYHAVNSAFPPRLARACRETGTRLAHISTDCVFSGAKGLHVEDDPPDAEDPYGLSKRRGEELEHGLVVRTSFVGPETANGYSLLAWVMSRREPFPGFTNHLWNGVTSLELARLLAHIHLNGTVSSGLLHLYGQDMDKHTLCSMLAEGCEAPVRPYPQADGQSVDRRLRTRHPELLAGLGVRPLERQVRDMAGLVDQRGMWKESHRRTLARVQNSSGFVDRDGPS